MGNKRIFTKMHLWWGYNNMQIKEGDEWKAAFTTHIGLYEPVVMFFGLTNLPTMYQDMMNKILRDMINEGKVVAFVDDVLIGTEIEEGHDECHKLHLAITPQILAQFPQSKMCPKALKKTF